MTVYFSHATSFCGAVWDPVLDYLDDLGPVVWDQPGHGRGPSIDLPVDWADFGRHVLDVTEPGGVGVGHSMGAAALAMAQAADPGRFKALILVEPIIYPPPFGRRETPMSDVALNRRRTFDSRQQARANFADKAAFATWHPAALDGYIQCGFVGDGPIELACAPEFEADIYEGSTAHDTWNLLPTIEIPVLLMYGNESDTIDEKFARAQVARFLSAGLEIVPDTGHFLPMERPDLIADRVRRLAKSVSR